MLGRNLTFESRGAGGSPERLPVLVAELIASRVEVIVAFGYAAAATAKAAGTVPLLRLEPAIRSEPASSKAYPDRETSSPVCRTSLPNSRRSACPY